MWSSSLFGGCCIPYEDPKQLYKCFTVANKYLFSFAKRLCIVVGVSFTIALVEFHRIVHLFGDDQPFAELLGFAKRLCIVVALTRVSFTIALVEFHRIAHLFGLHQCLGQRFGFCEHHEK
jgi:hypothetical protein